MKHLTIACLAATFLAAPLASHAQGLTTSITLVSNYKSRGQDQSSNKPTLQAGVEYQWANGFYLGNWNARINWSPEVNLEMDVYGGYRGEYAGFDYSVGFFRYGFPGYSVADTLELNASVGKAGLELRVSESVSNLYFSMPTRARYLNLSYAHPLSETLSLVASVGRTNYLNNAAINLPDFSDFNLGLQFDLGEGWGLSAGRVGANRVDVHGIANKPRWIVSLTRSL